MEEKKVIVMDEDGTIIENETEETETEAEVNVKEETMMNKIVNMMKSSGAAVVAALTFIGVVAIKVVTNHNDKTNDDKTNDDSEYNYDYLNDVSDDNEEDINNETEEENEDEDE